MVYLKDKLKVGDLVRIEGLKNPVKMTSVGKVNATATGDRGGKYSIGINSRTGKMITIDYGKPQRIVKKI